METVEKLDRDLDSREAYIWKKGTSTFNYYAGYFSNTAIFLWLTSRAFAAGNTPLSIFQMAGFAFAGLFGWTFMEYWFHRIPYHRGDQALKIGHLMHHESPKALLGIPYYLTAIGYVPIYYLLTFFLDASKLGIFMGFLWLGYICYCAIHHSTHHFNFKNALFRKMRSHHLIHHHHPSKNFAITFPPWDYLFRTQY